MPTLQNTIADSLFKILFSYFFYQVPQDKSSIICLSPFLLTNYLVAAVLHYDTMQLMASSLDTLQIYERLKGAKLDELAAKEIAEVIKDVAEGHLATKDDIEQIIANAKVEIIKWVAGMLIAQAAIVASLVKLL